MQAAHATRCSAGTWSHWPTSRTDECAHDARTPNERSAAARLVRLGRKGSIDVGYDADLVVWDPSAEFTVEGTNDGPLGSMKPTGRKMSLPFCEICRFDKQGRIVSGGCYYDQYTLLTQLGHIQPLAVAA